MPAKSAEAHIKTARSAKPESGFVVSQDAGFPTDARSVATLPPYEHVRAVPRPPIRDTAISEGKWTAAGNVCVQFVFLKQTCNGKTGNPERLVLAPFCFDMRIWFRL